MTWFAQYWPHIAALVSVLLAVPAVIHVLQTKDEVHAAIGWVGVILLSPILGSVVYFIAGINRMRRTTLAGNRQALRQTRPAADDLRPDPATIAAGFGGRLGALATLADSLGLPAPAPGNTIRLLDGGDETYAAMLDSVSEARHSILLESYIFDSDHIGQRLAGALIAARQRGVAVRVLIDAVGIRYSRPSIRHSLQRGGVQVAEFNAGFIQHLRLPYANLRTHRKILVVDGSTAFAGGMNIREGFSCEFAGTRQAGDTHFRISGPAVADIFAVAAEDWHFTTGEILPGIPPPPPPAASGVLIRTIPSGPDTDPAACHQLLLGAFSVARRSIRIMSPYFLPDRELISALATAARRGVAVDIIIPGHSNLALVDRAARAQLDQVLRHGCRVWLHADRFDHSKLMVIDGVWSLVGSSNIDPRSMRLNFEIDLEVIDHGFASQLTARADAARAGARPASLAALRAAPLASRLADRVLWLGSPYL